jgi:putative DNA primase/helicase
MSQSFDRAKTESPSLQPEPDSKPLGAVSALARFKSHLEADEQPDNDKQIGSDGLASNGNETKSQTNKPKLPSKISRAFHTRKNPSDCASSFDNAITAIDRLGIDCRYDVFHDRMLVSNHPLQIGTDENLDSVALMVRRQIVNRYGFDPGQQNVFDAIKSRCLDNMFDPVADYLANLKWDGVRRLDTWLTTHLDAEDNPLNRAIVRKMLIAAVRRVRHRGCKFDFIPTMDNSKQGKGKSTVISILAGQENFLDQDLLGLSNQEQQEQVQGVWLYELAGLSGLGKTDINKVKSFASRQYDRARPAYGRNRVDRPRRGIFIGTTNDPEYLQDPTGNRRFWPFTPGGYRYRSRAPRPRSALGRGGRSRSHWRAIDHPRTPVAGHRGQTKLPADQ